MSDVVLSEEAAGSAERVPEFTGCLVVSVCGMHGGLSRLDVIEPAQTQTMLQHGKVYLPLRAMLLSTTIS